MTPYLIVKFLSEPLEPQSLTVHLSHSYSPPYASRIEPSIPPSTCLTECGTPSPAPRYPDDVLSVQYTNGLAGSDVPSRVNASDRLCMFVPETVRAVCLYEMCTAWNVTTPFIGLE